MKKKYLFNLAAIGSALALVLSGSSIAQAVDATPEPTPSATAPAVVLPEKYQAIVNDYAAKVAAYQTAATSYSGATTFKDATKKFQSAMKTWQALQKQNVAAKKAIARLFQADVKAIKTTYTSAVKAATTDAEKLAAGNARKQSMAATTVARNASLKLITKVPAHPDQPKKSSFKSATPAPKPTPTAGSNGKGKAKGKGDK